VLLYGSVWYQATGVRLGMAFQSFASIGTGIIIGFIFSWELTLFIIGFIPFFLISGVLQMKVMKGFSSNDNAHLELAGKV
jgi:ATP-binding cassette subfamily B (MDR/TAP) protein 1